jgi:FixJ family two-component response regulator
LAEHRGRHETLTARERQAMATMVQGLMNKQVVAELRIRSPQAEPGRRRDWGREPPGFWRRLDQDD